MPIALSRPTDADLNDLLARIATENPTYTGPSATAGDPRLPGYRYGAYAETIGSGDDAFERGKDALRHWAAHHQTGAAVAPVNAPLVEGTDVIVTLRLGPAFMLAPCRIISVVDEPRRFGFTYATLPGHPEDGEEAFHLERGPDDAVVFRVQVVARPALLLVRLGGPLTTLVQKRVTRQYLKGVRLVVSPVP
ncbi:MAG TPA: DUF1990 domain-containing protein [Acidimicrobiales bacterium]|nr:DUF1990 domain-containing protein [Acidimicrobiales bacterium]